MPQKEFQNAFNTGEISPDALARIDVARYPSSCRVLENFLATPVGGVRRRDGFRKIRETKNSASADSVLIPYDDGEGFRFMLEFSDLLLRIFDQDGDLVTAPSGPNLITNGDFPAGITSWTDKSTGGGIFAHEPTFQQAILRAPAGGDVAWMEQSITTVIGQTYVIEFDKAGVVAGQFDLLIGTTSGGSETASFPLGAGSHIKQFVATATTHYIGLKQQSLTSNPGPELVVNGKFTDNLNNWTDSDSGSGAASSYNAGRCRCLTTFTGDKARRDQQIATVIGESYTFSYDFFQVSHDKGFSSFKLGTTQGASDIKLNNHTATASGVLFTFTATTTSVWARLETTGPSSFAIKEIGDWDNVSMMQDNFGSLVDNVLVQLADSPIELVTTIPQAELEDLQYAQLEGGMQLTSDGIKLTHLVPAAASSWTITTRDWEEATKIPGATGTAIGDLSGGGGLAAGFDGDTVKTGVQSAQSAAGNFSSSIGKNWGVGNERVITGVNIWSSSDEGFWDEPGVEAIIKVQGSNDNFSVDIQTLAEISHTVPSTSVITKLEIFNLNDIRTKFQYHRVLIEPKSTNAAEHAAVAEIEFYEDLVKNPPGLNDQATNYAPAIGRYQQRSITGGQAGRRATVYGTASGKPFNMGLGQAGDADAFEFELDQTGQIRWFLDTDDLVIGTSTGVTRARGTQGPLSASDKIAKPDVAIGCAPILPAKMGNAALYIQTDRKRVQEVKIDEQGVKLAAADMSQLAEHIGEASPFKGVTAQPDPNKVLWCYLDSGKLVGLTYDRAENLFAWHQHPMSNGQITSIKSLPDTNGQTRVWAIIKRTINGATKRTIEVMDPEVYSDGAVKYSGVPATTITGLEHLEGETVTVYGDGYYRGTFVVSGGQIELQETMTSGDIGLGFIPKMIPVPPIRGQGGKTSFATVNVFLNNTQSLWINGKRQSFRKGRTPHGPSVKFSGKHRAVVLGWFDDPEIIFEAREPGPCEILSYAGWMELEDSV